MSSRFPKILLSSGHKMPQIGLGTWLAKPGEVATAVEQALKIGYRHIDCAVSYENQHEIGPVFKKALEAGHLTREELFVTSKVWNTRHSYNKAKQCVGDILRELQLDYLDLCLIHWPVGYFEDTDEVWPKDVNGKMRYSDVHFTETWRAMEDLVYEGRVRSIGLSNFNHHQIDEVLTVARIKPAVLQVELHPYFQQRRLRDYCQTNGIAVTAYSPLGNPAMAFRKQGDPSILSDPVFLEIAAEVGKSPAQVALRWAIQEGIIIIPKSVSEKRLKENIDIFDLELSGSQIEKIRGADRNWRILNTVERDGAHPLWGFGAEY